MFVALSKFVVANDLEEAVALAFVRRPHLVDDAEGFQRLDVMRPVENPKEFWLITYWRDEDSFRTWHRGHTYKASHENIPKGLKLVQNMQEMRFFSYVAS